MELMHVWLQLLITGSSFTTVLSACELSSRIKHNDSDVIISQNDQLCTLILTARNNKQVVVVMYDMMPDCVEKSTVLIYDGMSTSGILLTNKCQAYPWSFTSRMHSLTLTPVPGKPLRPFSLDVHAIDTLENYTSKSGTIRSKRYQGFISGSAAMTTPNNFHAFYRIMMDKNVTISLYFKEFNVEKGKNGCKDFVKIHGAEASVQCGETLPQNVTVVSDELSLEFQTDNFRTYGGFEADYLACIDKRFNESGEFHFPIYQLGKRMRCTLDIYVEEGGYVLINMTIHSNTIGKECKDILRIVADNVDVTDNHLLKCKFNTNIKIHVAVKILLRTIFTSENKEEFVRGQYSKDETITSSSSESPSSQISSKTYTDIIIAAVSIFGIVVVIIVGTVFGRRMRNAAEKKGSSSPVDHGKVCFKAQDELDIYADNENYDHMWAERSHIPVSSNESSNIYGGTWEPSDIYAVVHKTRVGQTHHCSENLERRQSDDSKTYPVKNMDENIYD